jgi:hypothetical protein
MRKAFFSSGFILLLFKSESESGTAELLPHTQASFLVPTKISGEWCPQGADPSPPPLHVATAGENRLNEEIIPLLPTGIGERYCQAISNLGHAALLRRCELPLKTKVLN